MGKRGFQISFGGFQVVQCLVHWHQRNVACPFLYLGQGSGGEREEKVVSDSFCVIYLPGLAGLNPTCLLEQTISTSIVILSAHTDPG